MGIDEHVRILGGLLVAMGIVGGIAVLAAIGILGSPFGLMADATQAGSMESIEEPLLKLGAAVMMVLMAALAVPCVVTGAALRKFRPWSRDTSMVVFSLLLAIFPVGTLLGVYGFWVVLSPEVEPLFSIRRD